MDPSHVALIDIFGYSTFISYKIDSQVKIWLSGVLNFSKLIKRTDKKKKVNLSISDEDMLQIKTIEQSRL